MKKRTRRGLRTEDVKDRGLNWGCRLVGSYTYKQLPKQLKEDMTPAHLAYYRRAGRLPNSRQIGKLWHYDAHDLADLPFLAVRGYYSL